MCWNCIANNTAVVQCCQFSGDRGFRPRPGPYQAPSISKYRVKEQLLQTSQETYSTMSPKTVYINLVNKCFSFDITDLNG